MRERVERQDAADWAGKNVGLTDLGSGTDDLTLYLAQRSKLSSTQFTRIGVGDTFIAAMQHGEIVCGMTSQPTVTAIEKQNIGLRMRFAIKANKLEHFKIATT